MEHKDTQTVDKEEQKVPLEQTTVETEVVQEKQQKVTAFEVEGDETGVDYDKLIEQFGCHKINPEQVLKLEALSGVKAH